MVLLTIVSKENNTFNNTEFMTNWEGQRGGFASPIIHILIEQLVGVGHL